MKGSRQTLTVSIGRNHPSAAEFGATRPLGWARWQSFKNNTTLALLDIGAEIHFTGEGTGHYQGQEEPSFTITASVVSDTTSSNRKIENLRARLSELALAYDQECIALVVGRSSFVNSDGTSTYLTD